MKGNTKFVAIERTVIDGNLEPVENAVNFEEVCTIYNYPALGKLVSIGVYADQSGVFWKPENCIARRQAVENALMTGLGITGVTVQ